MNPATLQRTEALAVANDRRIRAAEMRREIAAKTQDEGIEEVIAILANPDDAAGSLTAERLLTAIERVGPNKATYVARMAGAFDPSRRTRKIRDLTHRERILLAASLKRWGMRRGRSA